MRKLLAPFLFVTATATYGQTTIGEWRDHFSYANVIGVVEGGSHIYAASVNSAFRYDQESGEIERENKTNKLSDVGVQGLSWNAQLQATLVYYTNGNLDLLQGDRAYNIGDIKRSSIVGDKGVYSACMDGQNVILGCGFGMVLLDLTTREVRDTWFIGPGGTQVRVNGITMTGDSIYAATANGLFVASRNSANLAYFGSWRRRSDVGDHLVSGPFNAVVSFGDLLLLNVPRSTGGDSLLILGPGGGWTRFEPLFGKENRS
jgi:hypothetical protein